MSNIWDFIKRNIFTIVIIATMLVAMPWLGYIFVIPLILAVVVILVISWKVYKFRRQLDEEMRQRGGQQQTWWQRQRSRREGEVTVVQTEQTEQKVSDDVGEYVEFKEIKNDKG